MENHPRHHGRWWRGRITSIRALSRLPRRMLVRALYETTVRGRIRSRLRNPLSLTSNLTPSLAVSSLSLQTRLPLLLPSLPTRTSSSQLPFGRASTGSKGRSGERTKRSSSGSIRRTRLKRSTEVGVEVGVEVGGRRSARASGCQGSRRRWCPTWDMAGRGRGCASH